MGTGQAHRGRSTILLSCLLVLLLFFTSKMLLAIVFDTGGLVIDDSFRNDPLANDEVMNAAVAAGKHPPRLYPHHDQTPDEVVGLHGGAWTAQTHLSVYGFNADAGLIEILQSSCREIENSRSTDKWTQTPADHPMVPLFWNPPKNPKPDCKVLELGCGVGLYVDSLKKNGWALKVRHCLLELWSFL